MKPHSYEPGQPSFTASYAPQEGVIEDGTFHRLPRCYRRWLPIQEIADSTNPCRNLRDRLSDTRDRIALQRVIFLGACSNHEDGKACELKVIEVKAGQALIELVIGSRMVSFEHGHAYQADVHPPSP